MKSVKASLTAHAEREKHDATKQPRPKEPTCWIVLLYPPVGVPRVVEMPDVGLTVLAQTFKTEAEAEAALEKFLTANPEYRRWKDGRIEAEPPLKLSRGQGGFKGGTDWANKSGRMP